MVRYKLHYILHSYKCPDVLKAELILGFYSNKISFLVQVGKEDKEEVICRLHQLLVVLCTNHKLGVAFVDPTIGLDTKNYNELVFSVIKVSLKQVLFIV